MAFSKPKTLTAVKTVLEVLYVMAIIGCVFLLLTYSVGLTTGNKIYSKVGNEDEIPMIMGMVLGLSITIIGLVGVIQENKCIVIVLLVFHLMGFISSLATAEFHISLLEIVNMILTAVFLDLVIQKQKEQQPAPIEPYI